MRQLLLWVGAVFPTLLVSLWLWNGYHLITSVNQVVQQATQAAAVAAASQTNQTVSYDSQGTGTIQYVINSSQAKAEAQQAFVVGIPNLTTTPVTVNVTSPTSVTVHETATYVVPGAYAALLDFFHGQVSNSLTIHATATANVRNSATAPQTLAQIPVPYGMTIGTIYTFPNTVTPGWVGQPAGATLSWNYPGPTAPNGSPMIFATVVKTTSNSLNIQVGADDTFTLYVDGNPVYIGPASWDSSYNVTVSVSPGYHVIEVFAENTAGNPQSTTPNPAGFYCSVVDGSGTLLASVTSNPAAWEVMQPVQGNAAHIPFFFQGTSQTNAGPLDPNAVYTSDSGTPTGPPALMQ